MAIGEKQRLPPVPPAVTDPLERALWEELRRRFDRLAALDPGTATAADVLKALTGED